MTFIEFLGLIISLVFLAVISARQAREERKRRQNPELYEQEQEKRRQSLQQTLREMHIEIEREEEEKIELEEEEPEPEESPKQAVVPEQPRLAPTRMVQRSYEMPFKLKQFQQVRPIDQRRLTSVIQQRRIGRDVLSRDMAADFRLDAYTQKRQGIPSAAMQMIRGLRRPSDMVLLYTIWEKPKGLQ